MAFRGAAVWVVLLCGSVQEVEARALLKANVGGLGDHHYGWYKELIHAW
jgi:hypothetical protein